MVKYIAAGANRHPGAADWHGDILAYGTDRNVAIWNPQVSAKIQILFSKAKTAFGVVTKPVLRLLTNRLTPLLRNYQLLTLP